MFLRWLLIERARYFRKFPERSHPAWYVYTYDKEDNREDGKLFFLGGIGITCLQVDYAAILDEQNT